MEVRCPKCNSLVDRRDVYVEEKMVYCRRRCAGVNRKHPKLANFEIPPPKNQKKPKETVSILIKNSENTISVTVPVTLGISYGLISVALGVFLIGLGSIYLFTEFLFKDSRSLFIILFSLGWLLLGFGIALYGIWCMVGGIRATIVDGKLLFGKVFGNIWIKKAYDLADLTDIRFTTHKEHPYSSFTHTPGFFLKNRSKPLAFRGYEMDKKEVDWLVWELFSMWKRNIS